jgi:hypothetical protein
MPKLLSTAYFPPVSYFAAMAQEMGGLILRHPQQEDCRERKTAAPELTPAIVYIEACENFQKQSYRNRCYFYGADGVQSLQVPILHEGGTHKQPISEIKIDWSKPWLLQQKRAIISAYQTSAYFEYYQDELFAILDSQPEKLFDLNLAILKFFIEKIGLAIDLRTTEEYSRDFNPQTEDDITLPCVDLRETIHPKRTNTILEDMNLKKPYFQVFAQKHGFQSDLSIMDLLFNEGPESILYLKKL